MLPKRSQAMFLIELRTTLCNPTETNISINITKIDPIQPWNILNINFHCRVPFLLNVSISKILIYNIYVEEKYGIKARVENDRIMTIETNNSLMSR